MCRWVAYFGDEPVLLEDILIRPKHALCKQVHDHYLPGLLESSEKDSGLSEEQEQAEIDLRNRLFNIDGIGIGFYTNSLSSLDPNFTGVQPALYKNVRPPLNDSNLLSLAANIESKVIFGHIRMAESTVVDVNNHPFKFGRWIFQHNGSVGNIKDIHRSMISLVSKHAWDCVNGTTDSEIMAALFFTYLTEDASAELEDPFQEFYPIAEQKAALFKTLKTIESLQAKEAKEFIPSSLNIAITSGETLLTLRYIPHHQKEPPSLYYSTTAGILLNRNFKGHPDYKMDPGHPAENDRKEGEEHGKHIVVGSEPSTYEEDQWKLIPKNSILYVESVGGEPVVEKVPGW